MQLFGGSLSQKDTDFCLLYSHKQNPPLNTHHSAHSSFMYDGIVRLYQVTGDSIPHFLGSWHQKSSR